jgi:heptosyltransferase-1
MKNILIIKLWAIGDILMATPMLNAIKAADPLTRVTWIVDIVHADVLAGHPLIDELYVLDSGSWRRLLRKVRLPAWIKLTRELNREMRDRKFDAVINCQPDNWWTRYLCAAPVRVALFPSPTQPASRRFYTYSIPKPKGVGLHNTDHFLQATSSIGFPPAGKKMSVGETVDEAEFYAEFAAKTGLSADRSIVVLAPYSTADNRSIDREFAARIANWMADEMKAQVVVTGGPGDIGKAELLAKAANVIVAAGTTLRQYISILRHADLVVTVDSSPMHLAAALDIPYVVLFGPTPVDERAPLEGRGTVLVKPIPCAPCDLPTCSNKVFQQCIRFIELDDVKAAVREALAGHAVGL